MLSEFRQRLLEHEAGERLLNVMLEQFVQAGLLSSGGKQRTDSTYVLASVRDLNRLELAGRTLQAALDAIAEIAPQWLQDWVAPQSLPGHGQNPFAICADGSGDEPHTSSKLVRRETPFANPCHPLCETCRLIYEFANSVPNAVDPSGMIRETPKAWNACYQQGSTSCDECERDYIIHKDLFPGLPYTLEQYCGTACTSTSPVTPTPAATRIVLFGGSQGTGNLDLAGPSPECQTPVWSDIADFVVGYPGTQTPDPTTQFTGKRLQALNAGQVMPNTLLIGYSAGADSALIYAYDNRATGNIKGVVLLDGELDGTRSDGRRMGCGPNETQCINNGDSQVWREMLDAVLQSGITVYFLDDKAGGGASKVADYQQPNGSLGRFIYDPRLSVEHLDNGLSGLRGVGTNNNEDICRAVLTSFGEDVSKCSNQKPKTCTG